MKTIISGKTILLNTNLNTTFVANEIDEEMQIGIDDFNKHIEWAGELDIPVCDHQYKPISNILWKLLDDIDTASDIIKPTTEAGYKKFYEHAMKKAAERFKYLISDGYGPLERRMTPEPDLTIE